MYEPVALSFSFLTSVNTDEQRDRMTAMPARTEQIFHSFKKTPDSQSLNVTSLMVPSVKTKATKPNTWIEAAEPTANPIRKLAVCVKRRVMLAAITIAILLVCNSVEAGVKAEDRLFIRNELLDLGGTTIVCQNVEMELFPLLGGVLLYHSVRRPPVFKSCNTSVVFECRWFPIRIVLER